jgi:cytochrome d ubiquinol oxidase subunit I
VTDADTALILARAQFAFTISFHFIFPAFSIGLASYLAVLEALWLKTGKEVYMNLFRYWLKIFAIAFGMGVVSGIVMTYQFGTNWSVFSDRAGPIIGPLMAYEVLTAFFLEAGFLGVMLFGLERVGKKLHFLATLMVAIGTAISAFWILSVNSWMHTPVGWALNDKGQFVPAAPWIEIIFNPSFPYRLVHTVIAAYLTTALVVGGVGAWHLLKERRETKASATPSEGAGSAGPLRVPTKVVLSGGSLPGAASPHPASQNEAARTMFSMAMWMAALVAPIQIVVGDLHGLNTLEYQPAKVMAMEGHYESHPNGAPLALFGIPDDEEERLKYAVEIPKLSSLILKHDANAPLAGLKTVPKADRPPAEIVFWSFRIMVGLGLLMLLLGIWSLIARAAKRLYDWKLLHRFALLMAPTGFIAVLAGWVTTEVGRQPFVIYNLLRTADARAPIDAPAVATSLTIFVIVYFLVFGAGTLYILRLMRHAPHSGESAPAHAPIRSAGITPGASIHRPAASNPRPDRDEEAER